VFRRTLALGSVLTLVACGGVGVEAPYVPEKPEHDGSCLTAEDALLRTRSALKQGRYAQLAPVIRDVLIDGGGLRVLVPVVKSVLADVPPADLLAIADGYPEGRGLARLSPYVVDALHYFQGTSPYIEGAHWEPLEAAHRVLTRCEPGDTLGAARRLLALKITLPDGSEAVWIEETYDALVALTDDPIFIDLLERLEFSEGSGEEREIAVGRVAFQRLFSMILGNVASPDFDIEFVHQLVEDFLITQLPEASSTRDNLTHLTELLEIVLDEDADIFPHAQALLSCGNRNDEDGAVAGMLYDYLSIEELDFVDLVDDVDVAADDPAATALRLAIVDGSEGIEDEANLQRDTVAVLARFISPDNAPQTAAGLLSLRSTGVAAELLRLAHQLFGGGCE
jgi:hypothetical protein